MPTSMGKGIKLSSLNLKLMNKLTIGNTGDVDPSNGDIDPPWILVTKKG